MSTSRLSEQWWIRGGASRVMRIGFIAWPQVYGNVEYGQTFGALGTGSRLDGMSSKVNEGYFWEIFAEYGLERAEVLGGCIRAICVMDAVSSQGSFEL